VSRSDLVFIVAPFVVLAVLSTGIALILRRRSRMDRAAVRRAARLVEPDIVTPPRDPRPADRPWWGNPWLWVGVSAAFVLLGLFVWRGLFGGIFLFVPFVWVSRPRTPTMDPRTNGHSKREGPV
jgi:hypothetical protein